MTGHVYLERGEPVTVLVRWSGAGPRNVLVERADGTKVVRLFRGLRRCPGGCTEVLTNTPPLPRSLRFFTMAGVRTVTIEEARAKLGDLVDYARLAGEPTLITRYGRPAAVVVGEEWFRAAEQALGAPGGTINGPSGDQDDH